MKINKTDVELKINKRDMNCRRLDVSHIATPYCNSGNYIIIIIITITTIIIIINYYYYYYYYYINMGYIA